MSVPETAPKDRGTALAEQRTDLAIDRTVLAAERSLMAWIRTALSMISFGFGLYKFFQYTGEGVGPGIIHGRPNSPRNLGLTLIGLGSVALSAAAWQHWHFLKTIGLTHRRHVSVSFVIAIAVILIGLLTFYGVLTREGPF
jgi:uncharacterized membrane protein YidH (DUF202 family)